jgi:glycosyltransferase involved in cell wall biosynthesis
VPLRLPAPPAPPAPGPAAGPGPVVLFLPARDEEATVAAVAFCDADGEYDPRELDRLVAPILEGRADYVVGSRFAGEIRRMLPHRRVGNRLLTRLLGWLARGPIGDGQSGYRALSWAAAADAEVVHDDNDAQVLTLDLLAKGYRYLEVPIGYRFRSVGRSFVRPSPTCTRSSPPSGAS